jgi:probable HAF family extracellular repeat protein
MQRSKHRTLLAVFSLALSAILLAALAVGRPATAQTTMTDLGTLPGGHVSLAFAINDTGQVVGFSHTASNEYHAVLWENNSIHDLGTLPGGHSSAAYAINHDGLIVGQSQNASGEYRAVLWENNHTIVDLGTLTDDHFSVAYDINNNGQIVGVSGTAPGGSHAVIWENHIISLLNSPIENQSVARAINQSGQVVGSWWTSDTDHQQPVIWQAGTPTQLGTFGLFPEELGFALDINDAGQAVGESGPRDDDYMGMHAALWQDGTIVDLSPGVAEEVATHANAINNAGQVVGRDDRFEHATLWQSGTPIDLGTLPGVSFSYAYGINDAGQVVGQSGTASGEYHAFVATTSGTAPAGGSIAGNVADPDGNLVPDAYVQVCLSAGGLCVVVATDSTGQYAATGLPDGQYIATAFPPASLILHTSEIGPLTVVGGAALTGQDIQLAPLQGPPLGTSITPASTGGGGIPVVYFGDSLELISQGCAGGTATYLVSQRGGFASPGTMNEGPAGEYRATIPPFAPKNGYATVSMTIKCPSGPDQLISFDIYIDPSGTVRTLGGAPIAGASVTLLRADSASGPFTPVPDGSALMSPANRANPDATDAAGHFGWDVVAGFYKVRAEKAGCLAPVESAVLQIPPPVTNLDLRLDCESDPPLITLTTPANNASYTLHQSVAASYSCTDDGAGVARCTGPVANGAAIDTSTIGVKTFTVDASDEVGNSSSTTAIYKVVYDFGGFFGPIATLPVQNVMQAGRAIPVQFSLHGDQGPNIFAAGYPKSVVVACDAGAQVDDSAATLIAGTSGLSYDAQTDQYTYVWKTEKSWAGSCRQLQVQLNDGTTHRANFLFKR